MDLSTEEEAGLRKHEEAITRGLLTSPISTLNPRAAVAVAEDTTVGDAVALMNREKFGALLVTRAGRLTGIFTERDVLNKIAGRGLDFSTIVVKTYMTPDPETLGLDDMIAYALNMMSVGGYRHVPLVDGDHRPVGMVSVRDVVEMIVENFPKDVLNLPPDPGHETRSEYGG